MEIRFRTGQEHKLDDLINSNENKIELIGWSSSDDVIIKDWKFINYKRKTTLENDKGTYKWVHFNQIIFINCTFKDINFIGGVPLDSCLFENCTFENCLLTDHIRWTVFDKCSFNFCIFGGYLHDSKFKSNCKFKKVLLGCYGDIHSSLEKGAKCTKKEKLELLKYFYPIESQVFDSYKKGDKYLIKNDDYIFPKISDDQLYKIDNNYYFIDKIKKIQFNLNHYVPEIRIIGKRKYAPLMEETLDTKTVSLIKNN